MTIITFWSVERSPFGIGERIDCLSSFWCVGNNHCWIWSPCFKRRCLDLKIAAKNLTFWYLTSENLELFPAADGIELLDFHLDFHFPIWEMDPFPWRGGSKSAIDILSKFLYEHVVSYCVHFLFSILYLGRWSSFTMLYMHIPMNFFQHQWSKLRVKSQMHCLHEWLEFLWVFSSP